MGFLHWLGSQFDSGVNSLRRLWDRVHQAISVVWGSLTSLGHVVGGAWHRLRDALDALGAAIADLAHTAYTQTRRLLTVTIPGAVHWTLTHAIAEARRLTGDLSSWAHAALRAVTSWTARIVAELRSWTGSAVRWLTHLVNGLAKDAASLRHALRHILAGPDAAAAWLFGSLARVAGRWLTSSAEAVVRYLAGHAVRLLLRSLHTVEQIITDVF